MSSCLGIYVNDNIIKFAKMSYERNMIKLEQYGTRFIRIDPLSQIESIIQETNSFGIPIAITPEKSQYLNIEMYEQGQVKSYLADVAKMEFEAWCEKNANPPQNYDYIYKAADTKNSDGRRMLNINVVKKDIIEKYTQKFTNIVSFYPANLLTQRLVSSEDQNYILVDLSDTLAVRVVENNKVSDMQTFDIGMKQILDAFSEKLGSYQKAYEACKQINVFSEGYDNNNRELEIILEPMLQNVLRQVQVYVDKYRKYVEKVILTGDGIVFTNIDILFTEFLSLKCEILRPEFLEDTSNVRNTADILETIEAIALAYDALKPIPRESEYIKKSILKKGLFAKKNKLPGEKKEFKLFKKKEENSKENNNLPENDNLNKASNILTCISISFGILLVIYVMFGMLYVSKVEKIKNNVEKEIANIDKKISEINDDDTYINTNTKKYSEINEYVKDITDQIESNKIGKFTTYNVATFLNNIIKIIPKNVQLVNIKSDDNKNVVITAKSGSYADLGYFVAELKINGTLNNIKINNIQNAENTVVEIGGELP